MRRHDHQRSDPRNSKPTTHSRLVPPRTAPITQKSGANAPTPTQPRGRRKARRTAKLALEDLEADVDFLHGHAGPDDGLGGDELHLVVGTACLHRLRLPVHAPLHVHEPPQPLLSRRSLLRATTAVLSVTSSADAINSGIAAVNSSAAGMHGGRPAQCRRRQLPSRCCPAFFSASAIHPPKRQNGIQSQREVLRTQAALQCCSWFRLIAPPAPHPAIKPKQPHDAWRKSVRKVCVACVWSSIRAT